MGATSRFQSVTLVQLVLSIRGPRCSARPVMYGLGREVDSCRNCSAKNSGATVVFSTTRPSSFRRTTTPKGSSENSTL